MVRAVSPNRQRVGTSREPPPQGIDPIGSWVEVNPFGRNGLCILPALEEDTEDPQNVNPENGLNNQDAGHVVPGLDPAAGNGDEDAANEHLQQIEQEDLKAVRSVLGQQISGNVVTVRHCWLVLKKLRDILPEEGSQKMPHGQDYARILERLARVITIPTELDYISAICVHPLGYECVFKVLEEMTPDFSCPLDYGECLDRLREDLTATSSMMRVADGIFVVKDRTICQTSAFLGSTYTGIKR